MPTLGKLLSLVRRQPWGLQRRTEPTPILLEEEIGLVIHRGDTFAGRNGIAKTSVKLPPELSGQLDSLLSGQESSSGIMDAVKGLFGKKDS